MSQLIVYILHEAHIQSAKDNWNRFPTWFWHLFDEIIIYADFDVGLFGIA